MQGNPHVRFLEGRGEATHPSYSTPFFALFVGISEDFFVARFQC